MSNNGPSRTTMLRELAKQKDNSRDCGTQKVIEAFTYDRTKVLVIRSDQVRLEFIEAFCLEKGLKFEIIGDYYHLS